MNDNDASLEHQLQAEVIQGDPVQEVAPDLAYKRLAIVNVAFFGLPKQGEPWVLIDAGLPKTAHSISHAAEERFGKDVPPAAIVLTHGHFDHVGALEALASRWQVPIYAHPLELPFLEGRAAYPPPDPSVGGGLMARLSGFYPKGPIDVSRWLRPLPEDGSLPAMPGWRWLHTPGHAPGHVSLWREQDRTLIVGDAFVTTKQESAYAVAVQKPELHGPPSYFTPDWVSAQASAETLAALEPETIITGHGPAIQGPAVREALHHLADNFQRLAVPEHGRYVGAPARADEGGTTYVPEQPSEGTYSNTLFFLGAALLGIGGYLAYLLTHKETTPNDRRIRTEKHITISRPAAELYSYWRKLENLPKIMRHLETVTELDATHSRWTATGPAGTHVSWDAEITEDLENKALAWRSLEGSDIANAGSVFFNELAYDRGTEVKVVLVYEPPLGQVGATLAKLMGEEPERQLQEDLRRFKQQLEAGEVATVHGQPSGRA